jgi:hypothetical protein
MLTRSAFGGQLEAAHVPEVRLRLDSMLADANLGVEPLAFGHGVDFIRKPL